MVDYREDKYNKHKSQFVYSFFWIARKTKNMHVAYRRTILSMFVTKKT